MQKEEGLANSDTLMDILRCYECKFTRRSTKYCENCQRLVCDQCALFPVCQYCFSLDKVFNDVAESKDIRFIRLTKNRKVDEISDLVIEDLLKTDSIEIEGDVPNVMQELKIIEGGEEDGVELKGKSKSKMEKLTEIIQEIQEGDQPQKKLYVPGILKFDEKELSTKTLIEIGSSDRTIRVFFDKDHSNVRIKYLIRREFGQETQPRNVRRSFSIPQDISGMTEALQDADLEPPSPVEKKKESLQDMPKSHHYSKDFILAYDVPMRIKIEIGVVSLQGNTVVEIKPKKMILEDFNIPPPTNSKSQVGTILQIKTQDFNESSLSSFFSGFFNQKKAEREQLYIKTEVEIHFRLSNKKKKKLFDRFLKKIKKIKEKSVENFRGLEEIMTQNSGLVDEIKQKQLRVEKLEKKIKTKKKSNLKLISIEDRMNELYFLIVLGVWIFFVSAFNPSLIV